MLDGAPLESPLLAELRDGDCFVGATWRIADAQHRTYRLRDNGFFVVCTVCDRTGSREVKCFDKPPLPLADLCGAFVRCNGKVENKGSYCGQIQLDNLQIIPVPDDPSRFEMPLPGNFKAHQTRFWELVASVRREELRALLKAVFDKNGDLWPRFQNAPAALAHHHNYRGGLLEHCGEVALLSDRAAGALCGVDRDLLVTAALLHDIGKIDELDCDFASGAISYSHAGELVGHVVLGAQIIARAADSIPGFPLRLKTEVTHLILSHHGEPEWGAARRPMCAEALILSQCDNLSAKIAACRSGCNGAKEDFARASGWHSLPHAPQNRVYVGRMRELNGD